ncbi:MAG TPA: TolC family protein [Methylomirabilota bacterium]|nr:TolC family protein [Methylomirabilota bacterium]
MKPILHPVFLIAIGLVQLQSHAENFAPTNSIVITSDFIAQLMDEAATNNPALLAAKFRTKSSEANIASVRVWDDPMFTVGGSVFSPKGFDAAEQGDLIYGISEKLPLWGKPALNRKAATAEATMRHAELDFREQQLRRDIAKQLFETALAQRVVEIGEQDLAWLQTTANAVESKYRAGQMDAADTLEIQNEVAKRADQLRTDKLEIAHDWFALNRLLNRGVSSTWPSLQLPPVASSVPFSAKLLALALTNEPQLKVMQREIEQAKAAADVARRSRLPDISVGVQGNQYSGDGGFRSGAFTLSFPLPWGNSAKYRHDYEREKENQKAAEQERNDQVLMTQEEVHHLTVDLDAARRQALLYNDEIVVRATQALTDKLAGWESGRVTLREVLDVRRDALDAQLMAVRATAEQYEMLADLLLWTGLDNFESLEPLSNEPPILHNHDLTEK